MTEKYGMTQFKQLLSNLVKRKNPDEMLEEARTEGLEKTLGVWDLIILGIGAIIGSGIFAVVGIADFRRSRRWLGSLA